MDFTTYQNYERRNAQDAIIRPGVFGKNTALANAQNTGIIDYFANNIDWLYVNKVGTDVTINGHALSGNITVTKSDVGLGNVDNVKQVAYVQGVPNAGKVFYVNTAGNAALMPNLIYNDGQLGYNI